MSDQYLSCKLIDIKSDFLSRNSEMFISDSTKNNLEYVRRRGLRALLKGGRFGFIIWTVVLFVLTFAAPLYARDANILIMYWRGPTKVVEGYKDGLRELGIEARFTEFNVDKKVGAAREYIKNVEDGQYDVIYCFGTTVTMEVHEKIKKTPILATPIATPIEVGMIQSWEHSGNNINAVSHIVDYTEQVNFIFKLGNFKKIGSIENPVEKNSIVDNVNIKRLVEDRGGEFIKVTATNDGELPAAVDELIRKKVDFVYLSSSLVAANIEKIAPTLNDHKIPTYARSESIVAKENAALAGIVSSFYELGKELSYRTKLILEGTPVSEIPSYRMPFSRQQIVFNRKTAEKLGITIPYALLRRAKIYPLENRE